MKTLAADFFDNRAVFLAQMQFGLAHEYTSVCQGVATCESVYMFRYLRVKILAAALPTLSDPRLNLSMHVDRIRAKGNR